MKVAEKLLALLIIIVLGLAFLPILVTMDNKALCANTVSFTATDDTPFAPGSASLFTEENIANATIYILDVLVVDEGVAESGWTYEEDINSYLLADDSTPSNDYYFFYDVANGFTQGDMLVDFDNPDDYPVSGVIIFHDVCVSGFAGLLPYIFVFIIISGAVGYIAYSRKQ